MKRNIIAASTLVLTAFFMWLNGCTPSRKSPTMISSASVPLFDLQGHRGCRGLMPENTIPAMLHALSLGVTTLEMDVVISADGEVVLSHEPFFNHEISQDLNGKPIPEAAEKSHNLYQLKYHDIKRYDVGLQTHPRFPHQQKIPAYKPLLADVIDSTELAIHQQRRTPCWYNIETKSNPLTDHVFHPAPAEFVDKLIAVLRSKQILDRTIIQSFDVRTLQYLHQQYPNVSSALLIEDDDKRPLAVQLARLGFTPTIYSPFHGHVDPILVQQCHATGMRIIPWTVNLLPRMQELKAMGVDGIISDYPNLFAKLQSEKNTKRLPPNTN